MYFKTDPRPKRIIHEIQTCVWKECEIYPRVQQELEAGTRPFERKLDPFSDGLFKLGAPSIFPDAAVLKAQKNEMNLGK